RPSQCRRSGELSLATSIFAVQLGAAIGHKRGAHDPYPGAAAMTSKASTLLLFGATGDLSQRMLLPSLCALDADELLEDRLHIIGTARSPMTDAQFRNFAREAVEKYLPDKRRAPMADFLNRLSYQ